VRPIVAVTGDAAQLTSQQLHDDLLDIDDVIGKRIVTTRLHHNVTVREENALAALEVMSRFAANPKWLIYLPPTMSPTETTAQPGLLEHPTEALAYFQREGIARVICEEKHMGSRAIVIVCRDDDAARKRFGIVGEGIGICYTRTGRRFFDDASVERELLRRICETLTDVGFWEEFKTDWACLDAELMPWSAKAQELLRQQYAAVGAAAKASLTETVACLAAVGAKNEDAAHLLERSKQSLADANLFIDSYRRYCWKVNSVSDLKVAPFHLLATEGGVHVERDHVWHMERLAAICNRGDGLLLTTPYRLVDVTDSTSVAEATSWWEELTARGGEGMVVKPLDFYVRGRRGLVQPAVKCRGPEYLRIIYGPEYLRLENLERLRNRSVARKRSLALREFALGIEALERFVRKEPLRRVHECVFGVLALESEPVDPRL
jgi:protein phosphatase